MLMPNAQQHSINCTPSEGIRKYLSHQATESLIHAFIFSHIDYCNGLLNGAPKHLINKLQRIQNMVARLVYKLPKFSHVTPLLINLHWLPVEYRISIRFFCSLSKQFINQFLSISMTCSSKNQQDTDPGSVPSLETLSLSMVMSLVK